MDWFVSSGEAETRSKGVELGQLLVNTDYIHHVVDEHYFEDSYLFFRFRIDGKFELSYNDLYTSPAKRPHPLRTVHTDSN